MRKIFAIIQKNLRNLLRSKSSAMVVFVGPILLVVLLGLSFSTSSKFAIDIGIYAQEPTNLTEQIINILADNQYRVISYGNLGECISEEQQDRCLP